MCIDLNIDIKEVTLTKPKRVHEVELQYVGQDTRTRTDYDHTILLLDPRNGEEAIVADASYAQYSFDNGIDTVSGYLATKVHTTSANWSQRFGECTENNPLVEADVWEQSKTAIITRTTDNLVVRELAVVGGMEAFLDMCEECFQGAEDKILAAVRREMEELRRRLERIQFGPDTTYLKDLEDLVKECDGAGHQTCMLSYARSVWPFNSFELFST